MKNAHLRFGTMGFHRTVGNTTSRFSLQMDRLIAERNRDGIGRAHFVSVVGGDAEIAAASAIVSDQHNFTVEGPDVPFMHANLGRDAQCYRASIQLSASRRQLRHLVAISAEFAATANSEASGRTLLANSDPEFVWTSMAQILGLPAVPEWANWFYGRLDDNIAISRVHGLGCHPVLISGTKADFLRWLSDGIRNGQIHFPETNGPAIWPKISLERILSEDVSPEPQSN
jgi:hypothetical protein